jgi:hypothetical protein
MLPAVPPVEAIPFAHQIDTEHMELRHPQSDYSSRSGQMTGNPEVINVPFELVPTNALVVIKWTHFRIVA